MIDKRRSSLTDSIMVISARFLAEHGINIEVHTDEIGWKSVNVGTGEWFRMTPLLDENGEHFDNRNIVWYDSKCEFLHGYYHSKKHRRTIQYADPHYFDELLDAAYDCWLKSITDAK